MMFPAFMTGSQVYGTPKMNSDYDLVVLVDWATFRMLKKAAKHAEQKSPSHSGSEATSASLRFGDLNLIVTTDPIEYAVWMKGTKELERISPVSREDAVAVFKEMRAKHGVGS